MIAPGTPPLQQLEEMRALVRKEMSAQREAFQQRMAKPVEERVDDGWCLAGLGWRRIEANDPALARFALTNGNDSRLREGDAVRLSRAGAVDDFAEASIYREDDHELQLRNKDGRPWNEAWLASLGDAAVIDQDFIDLTTLYERAFDAVPASSIGRECILPFLEGEDEAEPADFLEALGSLGEAALNDSQRDAVAECLAAPRCHLVQGPPGTGKTRALAELVARCVGEGERILITSFTHRAIHHALDAVARQLGRSDSIAKIGIPVATGPDTSWRQYERFNASPLAQSDEGWVVGATPFAIGSRIPNVEFDRVVVDEAGQMTMPLAIMAMLAGRKWSFFGDGQQLGPVVTTLGPREAREWSCFRMLERLTQKTVLTTGYRMNRDLTHWPSESFYGGDLEPAPGVADCRLHLPNPPAEPGIAAVLAPTAPLVWVAMDHIDGKVYQKEEALAAARLVAALLKGGLEPEDFAVVVPFRKQARCIRSHLRGRVDEPLAKRCVIDTVERMQGQERELVIVSMASSDPMFIEQRAEFLLQPNRLNVAVTRARTKTIVLASRHLAAFRPHGLETSEDFDLFQSLLRTATRLDHAF